MYTKGPSACLLGDLVARYWCVDFGVLLQDLVRVWFGVVLSTVEGFVRVRFCCLVEIERPRWEIQAEQYSDTVLRKLKHAMVVQEATKDHFFT